MRSSRGGYKHRLADFGAVPDFAAVYWLGTAHPIAGFSCADLHPKETS